MGMDVRMAGLKRVLLVLFCLLGMQGLGSGSSSAAVADPVAAVRETVDAVIAILQDEKLAAPELKQERRDRVVRIVEQRFDFREMSMRSLARNWKERSPEEQERFVQLFKKLLENTYINKIDTYSGEKVVFKKHAVQGDKAIVYSDLVRNNVETPVNYRLKNSNDTWMVYDVEVEGVSLVNNYRTQFASILNKENFAALLARLEERVSKNLTE